MSHLNMAMNRVSYQAVLWAGVEEVEAAEELAEAEV